MKFVDKDSLAIYIALGANMPSLAGSPQETLLAALNALAREGLEIVAVSRFYKTPAFPAGSGPDYVNACAKVKSRLAPNAILATLHAVEAQFGRVRAARWASRGIDLALLAVGGTVLPDAHTQAEWRALPLEQQMQRTPEGLILPHPRAHERGFVLIPLADIAPDYVDPVSGMGINALIAALPEAEKDAIAAI